LAVVVVRSGVLPSGADEAVAESGGRALLVGDGCADAAEQLTGVAHEVRYLEWSPWSPGAWAEALRPLLQNEAIVVLPASPDGRDLAPRLAAQLGWPCHSGVVGTRVDPSTRRGEVTLVRRGGLMMTTLPLDGAAVVTLQPGVRGVLRRDRPMMVAQLDATAPAAHGDARVEAVLPPDAATVDLAEAPRIVAGGAGLDGSQRFGQLAELGTTLAASVGATRVITDRGWIGHERQIGTTGVVVDPTLYLAFGISGAVQHTSGLGDPAHVISVNTDPHCPMMQMADLAITADANATLDALLDLLASRDVS
jgi:electron transfer flavoprotein alpha subunit